MTVFKKLGCVTSPDGYAAEIEHALPMLVVIPGRPGTACPHLDGGRTVGVSGEDI